MDRNAKRRPQKILASKSAYAVPSVRRKTCPEHFADGFRRVTAGYIRQFCPSLPFFPLQKNFPKKNTKKPACAGRRAFMLQKSAD